jgi:ABC-type dipeptide/oligopeptide/nickel transport system ATPase component
MESMETAPIENQNVQSQPIVDDNDSFLITCQKCGKGHNGEELCVNKLDSQFSYLIGTGRMFQFRCVNCNELQQHNISEDQSTRISNALPRNDQDDGNDSFEEVYIADDEYYEDQNGYAYGEGISDGANDTENTIISTPISATQNRNDKAANVDQFEDKIKKIDKNLSEADRAVLIRDSLKLLVDQPSSNVEVCLKLVKDEFKLNAREIEAFRKDFNGIKAAADAAKKQENAKQLLEKFGKKPKVLTEQEREEALAYLKNPKLIENISKDLTFAGEIIGEETNKMMLYLASISIKFEKPISLVIFGKSSSGKSHLANAVAKFIPDEDSLILSSSTLRAFDYAENLQHKFVLVQEYEGIENNLSTIRVLQSEGKLSRAVSVKSPDDSTHKSILVSNECSCSVVFTTTREDIHDENSTRIFELYADESLEQTENVVKNNILKSSMKYKNDENQKKRIIELHKNVQRILEPIEVDIPFAEHINFPAKSTRNRRDSERFIQLIKAVAFLRQKQKQVKEISGKRCVEADHYDYKIAYSIGLKVISETLDHISDRARNVLRVCCELSDDLKKNGNTAVMTVKQIHEKASALGLDSEIGKNLYGQLDKLVEYEYLSDESQKFKRKKYYTVIFPYARDESGEIVNIRAPEIKEITTPDQLREKLLTN